jgi:hypothetical protein
LRDFIRTIRLELLSVIIARSPPWHGVSLPLTSILPDSFQPGTFPPGILQTFEQVLQFLR